MTEDGQLLRQYADERSETAFGELVNRHIDLVYSAALRIVGGDTHLAQDVTQMVFTDLARKAGDLPQGVLLPGWLYRHACFTASKAVRTERRRQTREQTATEMNTLDDNSGLEWEQLAPHLDDSLNELSEPDRDAIVLRFLKRQDLRAVGATLGISEDAAQKRVSRALEKLRELLGRRGVTLSVVALGTLIGTQAVSAAPVGLAVTVTAASLAGATATGTGAGAATLKLISMTKLQLGIIGAVVLTCVVTPLAVQHQTETKLREENQSLKQQLAKVEQLKNDNRQLVAETARLSNLVAQAKAPPAAPPSNETLRLRGEVARLRMDAAANQGAVDAANAPKPVADMFKQPGMKELIRAQQKTMFSSLVEKNYKQLFADLQLAPEQTAAVKDLLIEKFLTDADFGMAAMSGEMDGAKRLELAQKLKTDKDALDAQIKQSIGEDNYAKLQAYDGTMIERTTIATLKDQLASSASPLNAKQESQLLQAMIEERQTFKFTTDLGALKPGRDSAVNLTDENLARYQQEAEQLGQRFLERAQGVLSPEQLVAYGEALTKMREMQKTSLEMGAKFSKMFTPKSSQ